MIHAYDKLYLEKARTSLGRMLDFAVYDLHQPLKEFWNRFLLSPLSKLFENGDTGLLSGKSGIEMAYEVMGIEDRTGHFEIRSDRSAEYWAGWALAYYQWETNLTFRRITDTVPIDEIVVLYTPYHEMDIRQFSDKMTELLKERSSVSRLKILRENAGLSQSALASLSDVPVRTIQQYEQRRKNINKAQAEYLVSLAKVLCCNVDDLMELDTTE